MQLSLLLLESSFLSYIQPRSLQGWTTVGWSHYNFPCPKYPYYFCL